MTWNHPKPKAAKQIEGDISPRRIVPAIGLSAALALVPVNAPVARTPSSPHADDARGRKIRQSARGEDCDVRIAGVCNFDPATTVWSHYPGLAGGRGMGLKSLDACGVYCCSACHDLADDRAPAPHGMTRQDVMLAWHEGHLRSLIKLHSKGLL